MNLNIIFMENALNPIDDGIFNLKARERTKKIISAWRCKKRELGW